MSDDYRKTIERAVTDYIKKQTRPRRKNLAPERDVNLELKNEFDNLGWFMQRFESKAKNINGVWRESGIKSGTPDWGGVTEQGYACWVESKAPGRLSTVSVEQGEFLSKVILRGGFGIVCDGPERLKSIYFRWLDLNGDDRKKYLFDQLPNRVRSDC